MTAIPPSDPNGAPRAAIPPATPAPRSPLWVLATVFSAVLALVGGILPWFHPKLEGESIPGADEIHVWDAGRLGLIGPVNLVIVGMLWIRLVLAPRLRARRAPKNARLTIIGALAALAAVAFAWVVSTHYYSEWDDAKDYADANGLSLCRGARSGFSLTLAAALIALAVGIAAATLLRRTNSPQLGAQPAQ